MKNILVLALVVILFFACAGAAVLLARGWFTLRTADSVPAAPTVAVFDGAATPTLAAALPPADLPAPIGGEPVAPAAGGFNGAFAGTLNGENGSSAPATLELTQAADQVSGRLTIGEGLSLDAGSCGVQAVPAGGQTAAGAVDPANPNHLETTGNISAGGFAIAVRLTADLAADGQTLGARADLDLPFICGVDPAISGTFSRQ